jgi:UDPglucose 6-dehydrogenase
VCVVCQKGDGMKVNYFIVTIHCVLLSISFLQSSECVLDHKDFIGSQNVTVLGVGYVGLVSGVGLASLGHNVICADVDQEKIHKLNQGLMPIFEPGIKELVVKLSETGRLSFSSDVATAIRASNIIIIAVGTPMDDNGDANLSALMAVADSIIKNLNGYKIICTKSTVPIGTNNRLKSLLIDALCCDALFDVVSNPEFLREGSALQDFFHKNPVVIGSDSEKALTIMENLYRPLIDSGIVLIKTDLASAETIKYAWNAYSAIKIAYVNQLSHLCNAVGANILTVVQGMSFSEKLLPVHMLKPGPGFGGSCLPKDTAALVAMGKKLGVDVNIVSAARLANDAHKKKIAHEFYELLEKSVAGKKIAVLGLSFKANTDDIRYSAAIDILKMLVADGAFVYAYDPQAMNNMKSLIPEVFYCSSAEEALRGADGVLLLTEWDEFKDLDLEKVANIMSHKVVMDARNVWDPIRLRALQFTFKNLGCSVH